MAPLIREDFWPKKHTHTHTNNESVVCECVGAFASYASFQMDTFHNDTQRNYINTPSSKWTQDVHAVTEKSTAFLKQSQRHSKRLQKKENDFNWWKKKKIGIKEQHKMLGMSLKSKGIHGFFLPRRIQPTLSTGPEFIGMKW